MIEIFIFLIILGIFAGLISGFFGIGSGVILVPAYFFLFNYLNFPEEIIPLLATGTSMTTMVLVIPNAAYTHYLNSNVDLNIVKKMLLFAFVFTIFARYLALNMESLTLQLIIAVSLILAAFQVAVDIKPKEIKPKINNLELALASCGIGLVTSLVGIGGGILMVPYFTFRGLSIREAIGTSSVMGLVIAISGAIGAFVFAPTEAENINWMAGSTYIPAAVIVGLSSIWFAKIGANISNNTSSEKLKLAFAIVVIISAIRIIYDSFI